MVTTRARLEGNSGSLRKRRPTGSTSSRLPIMDGAQGQAGEGADAADPIKPLEQTIPICGGPVDDEAVGRSVVSALKDLRRRRAGGTRLRRSGSAELRLQSIVDRIPDDRESL